MAKAEGKETDSLETDSNTLSEFRSQYLKDYRNVNIFLKSKKHARLGFYLSGFLWYIVLAIYLSGEIVFTDPTFIIFAFLAPVSSIITILLYINKKRYGFTQEELTYHEVAALIEVYQQNAEDEEVSTRIERFSEIVLDNDNPTLPHAWKDELELYIRHIGENDAKVFHKTFETVSLLLVNSLNKFRNLDVNEIIDREEKDQTEQSSDPSFFEVLSDSINSEHLSKDTFLWVVFIVAAVAGLGLGFLKDQSWGVLLVTIVFAGLRLYDSRNE